MEIRPTPDQEKFIRLAIAAGRLNTVDDAAREAMALWEERERRRAEILLAVEESETAVSRGEVRIITQQSMRDLAEEVGQRGRARLAKIRQSS